MTDRKVSTARTLGLLARQGPPSSSVRLGVTEPLPCCSTWRSRAGPTTFCISAPRGHPVVIGWDLLLEDGASPAATIKSVALVHPVGLRLVGAVVVPVQSNQLLGNGWDFPLTAKEATEVSRGVEWAARRPAAGAEVKPNTQTGLNLVVGGATTGQSAGSATGFAVAYDAAGHGFTLTAPTAFTLDVFPARC